MYKVNLDFDIEKELKDKKVRTEKISSWQKKIDILASLLSKGVDHDDHISISNLMSGYKSLIEFVQHTYAEKG
ncbi:MAG: hypothetical protein KAH32_01545 [Chlamydiia bacterium]|nr:hypothetical protein [Chlamydiia bacterium]